MHRWTFQPLIATLLVLVLTPAMAEPPSADGSISPEAARRSLSVLQDETQRADVVEALEAIANEGPATDAPDSTTSHEEPETSEAPVEELQAIVPLEAGGLIARSLDQVARWADSMGAQLRQIQQAVSELPAWFQASFINEEGRTLAAKAFIELAVLFGLGLAGEFGLRGLLRRPRTALTEHANAAEDRDQELQVKAPVLPSDYPARGTDPASGPHIKQNNGVALLQTMRDGVERVEAVPVSPADSGKIPQPATGEMGVAAGVDNATDTTPDMQVKERPADRPQGVQPVREPGRHWSALRHLSLAAAALVLDLLPLLLFGCIAGLVLHYFEGADTPVRDITTGFVGAYVVTRLTMAVVRLLVSPACYGLRVIEVGNSTSRVIHFWARCLVGLAAFGIALADAADILGAGPTGRLFILKLISLLVHLCAVFLIFQVRKPVGSVIAAPASTSGPLAAMRNGVARVWSLLAAALVLGTWVVWALGVENGFPKLIEFLAVSAGIVVAARLAAILLLGALGRAFMATAPAAAVDDDHSEGPVDVRNRLAEHLYPLVRSLVSFVITACAGIALLQAWGLDAIAWFGAGTIGRSLTSAALTILIAVTIAVVVWQLANASFERRIASWSQQGELMRAARLRTLHPMIRSGLLMVIVLIVGLTALSEIGINTTPLLAGASIIGIAVGFGSQKLVQDFITGIFLLMENAMQVGDWVTVAGVSGTVEKLSIRTVRMRAGDGSLHIVPFSSVSTVNNTNRGIGNAAVRISVGYATDVELAIAELKKIGAQMRSDPAFSELILADLEVWGVDAVDGSMVTLLGQIRCVAPGRWGVQREINRRIHARFRELGIQIAHPGQRVMVQQPGDRPEA